MTPRGLEAAAELAADRDARPDVRVEALAQVVRAVSVEDAAVPRSVVDALDDLALIDAAIAMKRTSVVCAALHQLGAGAELETTRKRVVRRLVAASAGGIELAGLAIEIGDVGPGAAIAARAFDEHIAPRLDHRPDPVVEAFVGWLAELPDVALAAVLRNLVSRVQFDMLFVFTTNQARRARLEAMARSILAS